MHLPELISDYICDVLQEFNEPENHKPKEDMRGIKEICMNLEYHDVLTLIEFMLQHNKCPDNLRSGLIRVFDQPPLVAYFITKLNGCFTVVARTDEESGLATKMSLLVIEDVGPEGAREHIRKAANYINEAKYKDSIRESVHAMEAVVLMIDPNFRTLGQALKELKGTGFLEHGAIMTAFEKLYGYTNDENGIRHAHIELDSPNVCQDEAMFMFSTCAAGATYLIKKHEEERNSP